MTSTGQGVLLFLTIALEMIEVGMERQTGTGWRFWTAMAGMMASILYYCWSLIRFMYRNLDKGS